MVITQPSHSNTGLFCPVFRCHSKTRPFANQTTLDHLNTGLVRYSDGYCNYLIEILVLVSGENCSQLFGVFDVARKLDVGNFVTVT